MMIRRLSILAMLVAVVLASAGTPADARVYYVTVKNNADRCVWFTLSEKSGIFGWSNKTAFALYPAGVQTTFINAHDVRARAEIRKHKDCTGDLVFDKNVGHTNSSSTAQQHATATVTGANGTYAIAWTEIHD